MIVRVLLFGTGTGATVYALLTVAFDPNTALAVAAIGIAGFLGVKCCD